MAIAEAPETGDYRAGLKALQDPKLEMPAAQRAAYLAGFRATLSVNQAAKAAAVRQLMALPKEQWDPWTVKLIAALGAPHQALEMISSEASSRFDWPSALWYPSMRAALNDPALPALLDRLGLMTYWRSTHTRPDACATANAPTFCGRI